MIMVANPSRTRLSICRSTSSPQWNSCLGRRRMTSDVCFTTISEQRALLDSHKLSPVELTEAYLRRIERLDSEVLSFARVTADRALVDARRAETELRSGARRSWMHGISVGLKDIVDTAGFPPTQNRRATHP